MMFLLRHAYTGWSCLSTRWIFYEKSTSFTIMDLTLRPSIMLEPMSPRWWWTILFLVGVFCIGWWIWKQDGDGRVETAVDAREVFRAWKKQWKSVKESIWSLSRREALQAIYVVYADWLEMVSNLWLPEKTLQEISLLAVDDRLAEQEKILFGIIYQPLFSEDDQWDDLHELVDTVYSLVTHRFDALVDNQDIDD